MTKMNITAKAFSALCLCLLALQNTIADVNKLSDYYVVEMILFTYTSEANAQEENWPQDIQLVLPEDPAFVGDVAIADTYPMLEELIAQAQAEEEEALEINVEEEESTQQEEEAAAQATDDANTDATPILILPLLDETFFDHQDTAKKIRQTRRYNLISHQVWLQNIGGKEEIRSVIFTGGEEKDGYYEVGGSISFYKGRFLHINTNLWRAFFSEEAEPAVLLSVVAQDNESPVSEPVDLMIPLDDLWPELPLIPSPAEEEIEEDVSSVPLETTPDNEEVIDEETAEETLEPSSPHLERVVLMQQKAKMRSREIHYLDHPLLGIIIEIRPYYRPAQ